MLQVLHWHGIRPPLSRGKKFPAAQENRQDFVMISDDFSILTYWVLRLFKADGRSQDNLPQV